MWIAFLGIPSHLVSVGKILTWCVSGRVAYVVAWEICVTVTWIAGAVGIVRITIAVQHWLPWACAIPFVTCPIILLSIPHVVFVALVILNIEVSSDIIILVLVVGS